jgi:hypothetical protein
MGMGMGELSVRLSPTVEVDSMRALEAVDGGMKGREWTRSD